MKIGGFEECDWESRMGYAGEIRLPMIFSPQAIIIDPDARLLSAQTRRILSALEDPRRLRRCSECGVWSIFAAMKFDRIAIPPGDYAAVSSADPGFIEVGAEFSCVDLYDCSRRRPMNMWRKP